MGKRQAVIFPILLLLCLSGVCLFSGCTSARETSVDRVIGVSLANQTDEWRIELKKELSVEASKYTGLRLIFLDAGGDTDKQKKDLDELLDYGADFIIVSPVDIDLLMPSVEKLYQEGEPVLLLDRAIKGYDYTCFFGNDDAILAQKEADAIYRLTGKGSEESVRVVNIIIDSYIGRQRAKLLRETMPDSTEIRQLIVKNGTRDETEDMLMERRDILEDADIILSQNDYIAHGAALALEKLKASDIKILGVDGFMGEAGGIEMVKNGIIDATIVCPLGAREAIGYIVGLINEENWLPKQVILRNTLVTQDTVAEYLKEKEHSEERTVSTVGCIQIREDTGFRRASIKSYIDAAKEYGVDIEIRECASFEEQCQAFEDFISAGKDVIVLSPIVEEGWERELIKARQRDIPVFLSDREVSADDTLYALFIGSDFTEEGARCMRWIRDNMSAYDTVRILELVGTAGSTPALGRGKGFRENMNNDQRYRIVESLNGDFSAEKGYLEIKEYLTSHGKDFDVLFCHNDEMMIGAVKAIKEAGIMPGEDVKIISVDGTSEALRMLQSGEVNFVAECSPLLGENAMRGIQKMMTRNINELPIKIITDEECFDQSISDSVIRDREY